jgi:hypothetical protein
MPILKPNTFDKLGIPLLPYNYPKVFLGGSIEMGKADDWQAKTETELDENFDVIIFNPRRTDWDASWKQTPVPGEQFYEQVDWELKAQDAANFIIYNFLPGTQSPITLLELGLYAEKEQTKFVVCSEDFWRYGNVKIVSETQGNNLKFFHSYDDMMEVLKIHLSEWQYATVDRNKSLLSNFSYEPTLEQQIENIQGQFAVESLFEKEENEPS